jgi:hypothetical protein
MIHAIGNLANDQSRASECFHAYDADGRMVYCHPTNGEVVDALRAHFTAEQCLFEQPWMPEAIGKEIRGQTNAAQWEVMIQDGKQEVFKATVHCVVVPGSRPIFVVRFYWVLQHEETDRLIKNHILQMARLASVGTLGGPMAHALNNPLASIRGFAEVLKRRFEHVEKVAYFSDKIVVNSDRMKVTIEQLRNMSRSRALAVESDGVDINAVVVATSQIMDEQFKMRNIQMEMELEDALPRIKGDLGQWEALFLALLTQSRDSFNRQADDRKRKIVIKSQAGDGGVCVSYSDTSGGFIASDVSLESNPMDLLLRSESAAGVSAFVVLEVLRRHDAAVQIKVEPEVMMELIMNDLEPAAALFAEDIAQDMVS